MRHLHLIWKVPVAIFWLIFWIIVGLFWGLFDLITGTEES